MTGQGVTVEELASLLIQFAAAGSTSGKADPDVVHRLGHDILSLLDKDAAEGKSKISEQLAALATVLASSIFAVNIVHDKIVAEKPG